MKKIHMDEVVKFFFTQYLWPYPPYWNFLIIPLAGCIQIGLRRKGRWRWLLPAISAISSICAVIALLTVTVPGVLFGEVYVALTIGLPGLAVLVGVTVIELVS